MDPVSRSLLTKVCVARSSLVRDDSDKLGTSTLQSAARRGSAMAMADTLSASKTEIALSPVASGRLRGHARWFLGLVLPLGAALVWEIIVRLGLSSGRLVPPPSPIFTKLFDLARRGKLTLH